MSLRKHLTREQLIVARRKCDESLLFFTRFFSKEALNQKFITSWHHEELCQHFEDFSNYKLSLLNINIPPRCSKTLIMMMSIARGAGMNHASNWLYITASDKLRKKTTTELRNILTHPYFKIMYGLELSKDQNSKDVMGFAGGGSLTTASVFGQIVGFGAGQMIDENDRVIESEELKGEMSKNLSDYGGRVFEGGIYCDDLNKPADSVKENMNNQNVIDVMFNTIFSRRNSHDTPLVNIQQRVGLSDITSALEEYYEGNEKARFVVMPVIYPDGKLLWEWRYPLDDVMEKKKNLGVVFDAQYLQVPQPAEGALFRGDWLNYFSIDQLPKTIEHTVGAIDSADTGADYLSFPSGCVVGDRVYITEWMYTQEDITVTKPRMTQLINGNKIGHTLVETNFIGNQLKRELENEVNTGCNIYGRYVTENKHKRIYEYASYIRTHFVFRNDILPNSDYGKAMAHLKRYMADGSFKIDDAPDSLYTLFFLLKKMKLKQFM